MQLTTLKCPACGAIANIKGNETMFVCDYCQNRISVIRPVSINSFVDGLNEIEQTKYANFITILNQAMAAGNFSEGYIYCNKALEVNPNSASIWENKAICTFWLSSIYNIEEKTGEIISYLNASKQNDPNSSTYEQTANTIVENLYNVIKYKYINISPERISNNSFVYSRENEKEMISCFRLLEMCYQINPNVEYLIKVVDIMINGKVSFVISNRSGYFNSKFATNNHFDAAKKVKDIINKIKIIKPDYTPPREKKDNNYDYLLLIIIISIILFFILFALFSKK